MKRFSELAHINSLMRIAALLRLGVVAISLFVLLTFDALSSPKTKLIKPGQLIIDGFRVKCGAIPALISENHPDFGAAKRGLIILNPLKLKRLPRGAKLLVYYHECAHQYVGGNELAADCWGVQKARREGFIDLAGLKNACSFVESLVADRRHPPGKMRCQHMRRCYNETFQRKIGPPKNRLQEAKTRLLKNRGFSRRGPRFYRPANGRAVNNKQWFHIGKPLHTHR